MLGSSSSSSFGASKAELAAQPKRAWRKPECQRRKWKMSSTSSRKK
jgi:hypothetical protein